MEYEITAKKGFDSKKFYITAESAEKVAEEIEKNLAFEISEGMRYEIKVLPTKMKEWNGRQMGKT